jgi:hypothetical protein
VKVQSKTVQDTYLLTASPQISKPNLTTRIIPDRSVFGTAIASRTTTTSGIKSIPGTQAGGSVLFDNSSQSAYSVPAGIVFTTSTGVAIKLTQSVVVHPRNEGQDGTVSASAVAVVAGVTGNITANALNTICCSNHLIVRNPQSFAGGVDSRVQHIVTQADIDSVRNALVGQLQGQALQQLQKQFSANEVEAEQPMYVTRVVSESAPGTQADEVRIQVSVTATTFVYNQTTARLVAAQLLNTQATIQLDSNYLLKGVPTIANPVVVQQSQNGIIYLSVAARGLWIHTFSSQQIRQWQQSIKGATPMLAKTYLVTQPGVMDVEIQLPFGTDHLPATVDQIRVVLVNS